MNYDDEPVSDNIHAALEVARLDFEGGNFAVAEPTFKRALQELPDDAGTSSDCLRKLITINKDRGDVGEAIRFALRLLTATKESQGDDSEALVNAMVQLAGLYDQVGRYEESGDLYYRARAISERLVYGEGIPDKEDNDLPPLEDEPEAPPLRGNAFDALKRRFKPQQENEELLQTKSAEANAEIPKGTAIAETQHQFRTEEPPEEQGFRSSQRRDKEDNELPKSQPPPSVQNKREEPPLNFRNVQDNVDKKARAGRLNRSLSNMPAESVGSARKKIETFSNLRINQFRPEPANKHAQSGLGGSGKLKTASRSELPMKGSTHHLRVVEVNPSFPNFVTSIARLLGQLTLALNFRQMIYAAGHSSNKSEKVDLRTTVSGVVIVILAAVAFGFLQPRKQQAIDLYLSMPHSYVTVDGEMAMNWKGHSVSEITSGDQKFDVDTFIYSGDWRDGLLLTLRSFFQRTVLLTHRPIGLVDEENGVLYSSTGAVATLGDEMRDVEDRVNKLYQTNQRYPVTISDLPDVQSLAYDNPLSDDGGQTLPRFEHLTLPVNSLAEARAKVAGYYSDMGLSGKWIGLLPLSPGIINCCSVDLPYPEGELQVFVMQSAGSSGKALRSGHSGEFFFIASENGRPVSVGAPYSLQSPNIFRPCCIWISQPAVVGDLVVIRHINAMLFFAISLALLAAMFFPSGKKHKILFSVALTCCLSIAAAYGLESHLL